MWQITAYETATLEVTSVSTIHRFGVRHDPGRILEVPCHSWVLENPETGVRILVDAGLPEHMSEHWQHDHFSRTAKQAENRAKLLSYCYDFVIQSHLHWDAASGIRDLTGAPTIYVQRAELQYAATAFPLERECYALDDAESPVIVDHFHQFQPLDGETVLAEGLTVIPLPGHTPGFQAVSVETAQGTVLLAGDLVYTAENLRAELPSSVRTDMARAVASLKTINTMHGVTVVPGHDREAIVVK